MGNFLIGFGIGVAAGVLMAPKSGSETRRFIANKASEGSDYVTDQARQLKDAASDLYDRGRNVVNTQKEKLSSVVSSASNEASRQYQQ